MQRDTRAFLLRKATRMAASQADAEDQVQETLLAGWRAGRTDLPFLLGILRHQAAMTWRTDTRRALRESACDAPAAPAAPEEHGDRALPREVADWIASLPRSLRQLVRLALHGLGPVEIRWVLGLTPAAFRQRVAGVKNACRCAAPAIRQGIRALMAHPGTGRQRHPAATAWPLRPVPASVPGVVTHDPDGHRLMIATAPHVWPARGN